MTLDVTIRQVEAYLAVARAQHFSQAAAELHMSAPHLSQTIKDLERRLGVQLLVRTTRSVRLTEAGEVFLRLAGRALDDLELAVLSAQHSAADRSLIVLGYTIGAGLDVVPRLLRTFAQRHPGGPGRSPQVSTVEFDYSDPSAGLRTRKVTAAIVRPPIGVPGLVSVDLVSESRFACLPTGHRLAARASVVVADLLEEPIIAAPETPGPWRDYWLLGPHRTRPAPVVAEAATVEAELHLVARGQGISIVAESVSSYYARPGITFVPIADLEPCRVALAWWPEDTLLVGELASIAQGFSAPPT